MTTIKCSLRRWPAPWRRWFAIAWAKVDYRASGVFRASALVVWPSRYHCSDRALQDSCQAELGPFTIVKRVGACRVIVSLTASVRVAGVYGQPPRHDLEKAPPPRPWR